MIYKPESRQAGETSITSDMRMTLMAESGEELESLLMRVKEESERADLRLNIRKLRSWHPAHYFMANIKGKDGSRDRFPLLGLQNHCR